MEPYLWYWLVGVCLTLVVIAVACLAAMRHWLGVTRRRAAADGVIAMVSAQGAPEVGDNEYHSQGIRQARVSFWFSIIFACLGFAVIVVSLFLDAFSGPSGLVRVRYDELSALRTRATDRMNSAAAALREHQEKERDRKDALRAREAKVAAGQGRREKLDRDRSRLQTGKAASEGRIQADYQAWCDETAARHAAVQTEFSKDIDEAAAKKTIELIQETLFMTISRVENVLLEIGAAKIHLPDPRELEKKGPAKPPGMSSFVPNDSHPLGQTFARVYGDMHTKMGYELVTKLTPGKVPPDIRKEISFSFKRIESVHRQFLNLLRDAIMAADKEVIAFRASIEAVEKDIERASQEYSTEAEGVRLDTAALAEFTQVGQALDRGLTAERSAVGDVEKRLYSLDEEVRDLSKAVAGGPSVLQRSAAVIGVVAGVVINAVAALFFVQSNRARKMMIEFFGRHQADKRTALSVKMVEGMGDPDLRARLEAVLAARLAGVELTDAATRDLIGERRPPQRRRPGAAPAAPSPGNGKAGEPPPAAGAPKPKDS